jgi:hypothetical protein
MGYRMTSVATIEPRAAAPGHVRVPEPSLTRQELIARAVALRPKLRELQDEHAAAGTYSAELHEEFRKAGFYRITIPRMFGGYEFDLPTYFKTMLEVARGDPGVGWCLALGSSHGYLIAPRTGASARNASCLARMAISLLRIGRFRAARRHRSTAVIGSAAAGIIAPGFHMRRTSFAPRSSRRSQARRRNFSPS